jgi:hypothetical protein
MSAGLDHKTAERKRKALERKHGEPYRIIRASNGEVAILPTRYIDACSRGDYSEPITRVIQS